MARCAMCFAPNRAELESRLLGGESVQLVAADLGVNSSAIYRHVRNHLRTQLASALRGRAVPTHVSDLAERLASLLDETEAVRAQARATNDGRLLLQAVQAETATVTQLAKRLGIDDLELIEALHEARALAAACGQVLHRYPEVLREVADAAARLPHGSDIAKALTSQVVPSTGSEPIRAIQQKEYP